MAALVLVLGSAADAPSTAVDTRPLQVATSAGGRGVSAWDAPGVTAGLRRSGAAWVYNWDSAPTFRMPRGVQFVPMIWDAAMANPTELATAAAYGPELLGFNEPDRADQADLSVEEALDAWPALESTGMRLGSPAVATGAGESFGWLAEFMAGAEARGLRVDFIAVHWYGSDFRTDVAIQQLRDYLTSVHDRYGLPVWLTEYALIRFDADGTQHYPSPSVQTRFARSSATALDALPWLEKYAWFALPAAASGPTTGLYRPDGTATPAGRGYRTVS